MSQRQPVSLAWSIALILATISPLSASQLSEQLSSRGLADFHAERYQQALDLFDQAVGADPDDPYALYYRGITRGQLGDLEAAIADLQAALARNPDLESAPLELGVALVKTERFAEAVPWLERAQRAPKGYAKASLYLGIAQLRVGQVEEAGANFERAARDSSVRLSAKYYQGIVAYQLGNWRDAEDHFTYVTANQPDSQMGREAAEFLTQMRGGAEPTTRLYGEVGFQYDSNVALVPNDDAIKDSVGISDSDDGRAVITVGGTYVPWRAERVELLLGYEFYQSLHFDLDEFDLQDHRPQAQLTYRGERFWAGLSARYDYYLLDTDSFLQSAQTLPWIYIPEPDFGRTEIFYRMRWRGFYQQPFETFRDAWNHSPGIRQLFYLGAPERYLSLGYRFDREDPINEEGNEFAYDGHEVSVGFGWPLPFETSIEGGYAYRYENYPTTREDDEHRVGAAVRKQLIDHLSLVVAYFGTFNRSDDNRFDYDRSIASVTVRVSF